jgi:peptide/nickel transport system permease protein
MSAEVVVDVAVRPQRRLTRGRLIWRRFLRNKTAVFGAAGILFLLFLALVGPHVLYWKYSDIDTNAFLMPPSSSHILGTTQAGRDVLALTARGLGKSLLIGFLVALISTSISALVGASAAYLGGWYEKAMLWIIDLLLVIPSFFLIAVASRGAPEGDASWLILVVLLAAFAWPLSARVVRSLTLSIREREYVLAAKFMGLSPFRIIVRHILPNASSLLIIDAALGVGYAILSETGLSYFGFGVQAPDTSLGTLIGEGSSMATTFPWIFLGPAAVLVFLVMCVNAVGDGLRDALDPSSASGGQA